MTEKDAPATALALAFAMDKEETDGYLAVTFSLAELQAMETAAQFLADRCHVTQQRIKKIREQAL